MTTFTDTKDPESVLPHTINWAAELALSSPGDTIATSTWTADNGLVINSNSKTTTTTTVIVSAGRLGAYCNLTNHITTNTSPARHYEATIVMEMKSK